MVGAPVNTKIIHTPMLVKRMLDLTEKVRTTGGYDMSTDEDKHLNIVFIDNIIGKEANWSPST